MSPEARKFKPNIIRIYKSCGEWQVSYHRLWDTDMHWAYPDHKENVLKASAHCEKLNSQDTANGTSS